METNDEWIDEAHTNLLLKNLAVKMLFYSNLQENLEGNKSPMYIIMLLLV